MLLDCAVCFLGLLEDLTPTSRQASSRMSVHRTHRIGRCLHNKNDLRVSPTCPCQASWSAPKHALLSGKGLLVFPVTVWGYWGWAVDFRRLEWVPVCWSTNVTHNFDPMRCSSWSMWVSSIPWNTGLSKIIDWHCGVAALKSFSGRCPTDSEGAAPVRSISTRATAAQQWRSFAKRRSSEGAASTPCRNTGHDGFVVKKLCQWFSASGHVDLQLDHESFHQRQKWEKHSLGEEPARAVNARDQTDDRKTRVLVDDR